MKFNFGKSWGQDDSQSKTQTTNPLSGSREVQTSTLERWKERAGSPAATNPQPTPTQRQAAPEPVYTLNEEISVERTSKVGEPAAKIPESPKQTFKVQKPQSELDSMPSALGVGTVIEGKFTFDSPVRIDGSLLGEVSSSSALVVGERAIVDATVAVGSLVVFGRVTGSVKAEGTVCVKRNGVLEADVLAQNIVVEEGGAFRGYCNKVPDA